MINLHVDFDKFGATLHSNNFTLTEPCNSEREVDWEIDGLKVLLDEARADMKKKVRAGRSHPSI